MRAFSQDGVHSRPDPGSMRPRRRRPVALRPPELEHADDDTARLGHVDVEELEGTADPLGDVLGRPGQQRVPAGDSRAPHAGRSPRLSPDGDGIRAIERDLHDALGLSALRGREAGPPQGPVVRASWGRGSRLCGKQPVPPTSRRSRIVPSSPSTLVIVMPDWIQRSVPAPSSTSGSTGSSHGPQRVSLSAPPAASPPGRWSVSPRWRPPAAR